MIDPPSYSSKRNVACLHSPDLFILISNSGLYGWTQMSAVSFLSRGNALVLPGETIKKIISKQRPFSFSAHVSTIEFLDIYI